MTERTYYVVVAFELGPVAEGFDPDAFAQRATDRVLNTAPPGTPVGGLDVAIREVVERKGKITSGQWGDHGV